VLKNSIDTNIEQDEFDDFVRLAQEMNKAKIKSATIDIGNEQTQRTGLLINPSISSRYNYEWVLIPRTGNGNFSEIQKYVTCEIEEENCSISKVPLN